MAIVLQLLFKRRYTIYLFASTMFIIESRRAVVMLLIFLTEFSYGVQKISAGFYDVSTALQKNNHSTI